MRSFHLQASADFLKEQNLDEAKLLKSYQIVPRVAPLPTFRKGLYAGGGELPRSSRTIWSGGLRLLPLQWKEYKGMKWVGGRGGVLGRRASKKGK